MKKRSYLSIWAIFSIVCTPILIVAVYGVIHVIAFPNGGYAAFFDSLSSAVSLHIALILWMIFICGVSLYYAREVVILASAFNNADERQEAVSVLSKDTGRHLQWGKPKGNLLVEFQNKSRRNFVVEVTQLNLILEGDTGVLTYKQNKEYFFFIGFRPYV